MSKLNKKKTFNLFSKTQLAGGSGMLAAKQTEIELLRRAVLANLLWEDLAYVDGKAVSDEIKRLVPLCKPYDVFDLTVEARLDQKLRHTPLFLAVEMCRHTEHRKLVAELLPRIITRADMITDFMALYWNEGRVPLCAQARKGLAAAFHNFDEYQLAKYNRNTEITLRDVMFMVHPKPVDKDEEMLFWKLANNLLDTPDTWEVQLSAGKDKKETWTRLIEERKLGALAMLRNLAGMKRAGVERRVISKGLANIRSAMLLPLDFQKAVDHAPEFSRDIERIMLDTYNNLPKLKGSTLFIVDVSGSMTLNISDKSDYDRLDAACAMAMLAACQCEDFELVLTAGNDETRVHDTMWIKYPSQGFDLVKQILAEAPDLGGGGIFTRQCLEWCREKFTGKKFDRIIIFSDSQDCDFPTRRTPHPFGKYNYICDVSAHTRGINYKNVWTAEISGWSEHFLTYIAALEGISNNFVEE